MVRFLTVKSSLNLTETNQVVKHIMCSKKKEKKEERRETMNIRLTIMGSIVVQGPLV